MSGIFRASGGRASVQHAHDQLLQLSRRSGSEPFFRPSRDRTEAPLHEPAKDFQLDSQLGFLLASLLALLQAPFILAPQDLIVQDTVH